VEATLHPVLDTLSAIEQRRSVKHYDPNFVMPEADEKMLTIGHIVVADLV
jgi:hypothetical protein